MAFIVEPKHCDDDKLKVAQRAAEAQVKEALEAQRAELGQRNKRKQQEIEPHSDPDSPQPYQRLRSDDAPPELSMHEELRVAFSHARLEVKIHKK